ncbi:hypothetical protein DBR06_SOUSAS12510007, partial [Sousa chinensis]
YYNCPGRIFYTPPSLRV